MHCCLHSAHKPLMPYQPSAIRWLTRFAPERGAPAPLSCQSHFLKEARAPGHASYALPPAITRPPPLLPLNVFDRRITGGCCQGDPGPTVHLQGPRQDFERRRGRLHCVLPHSQSACVCMPTACHNFSRVVPLPITCPCTVPSPPEYRATQLTHCPAVALNLTPPPRHSSRWQRSWASMAPPPRPSCLPP
jgi:hypothetical protein